MAGLARNTQTALIMSGNVSFAFERHEMNFRMVREGLADRLLNETGVRSECNLNDGPGAIINKPTTYAARAYQCLRDLHVRKARKGYPSSCETIKDFDFFFLGDSGYTPTEQADMLAFRLNKRIEDVRNAVNYQGALASDAVLISSAICSNENDNGSLKKFMGIIKGNGKSAKFDVICI